MARKNQTGSRSAADGLLGRVLESLKQFVPPADLEARRAGLKSGARVMESLLAAGFDEESVLLACCSALSLPPVPEPWLTEPPAWPRQLDVSVCLRLGVVPIGPLTEPLRLGFADVELAAIPEIQELPPHRRYLMLGRNQRRYFNAVSDLSRDATIDVEKETLLSANLDFDRPTVATVVPDGQVGVAFDPTIESSAESVTRSPLPAEVASGAILSSAAAGDDDDLLFPDRPAAAEEPGPDLDKGDDEPTVQDTTVPMPAGRLSPQHSIPRRVMGEPPLSTRSESRTPVPPESQAGLEEILEALEGDVTLRAVDDPTPAAVVEVKPPVRPPMSTGEFQRVPKSGRFREVVRTDPAIDEVESATSGVFQAIDALREDSAAPVGMLLRGAPSKVMAPLDPALPPERADAVAVKPHPARSRSIAPLDPPLPAAGESGPRSAPRSKSLAPLNPLSKERRGASFGPFRVEQTHLRSVGIFVAGAVSVLLLVHLSSPDTGPAQTSRTTPPPVASPIPVSPPRSISTPPDNKGLDLAARQRAHIEKAANEKNDQKAVNELSVAVRLDPRTVEARDALLARARRYLALGQQAKAEEDVARLLKRPDIAEIRESVDQLTRTMGR